MRELGTRRPAPTQLETTQLPTDWEWKRVDEVGSIKLGRQRSPQHQSGKFTTPYLRVANVFDGRIDYSDVLEMDFTPRERGTFSVIPGDILLNEGQSLELVGRSAFYDREPNRYCFQNTLIRFRAYPPNDYRFCRAVFSQWLDTGHFTTVARQTTSVAHLGADRLASMAFPVPPQSIQRKIARILTTVDHLIEKTERLIAKYQAIKQGMMHDLFTRGVDAHGHLRPPQAEAPDLYKQSELGWIPKQWDAKRLGDALNDAGGFLQTGPFGSQLHSYEYVEEGVPVVMPQDIIDGRILTTNIARITPAKAISMVRHRLRFNDVVFSRRGDLSKSAALSSEEEGWICGTGCFLLRCPADRIDSNWLDRQYRLPHVQKQVDARAVGSTMPSLNNAVMEGLLMLFPQLEEQTAIGQKIEALESSDRNLKVGLSKLALIKTGLMQDLLTGKVRVKVDEAEEVAP